MENKNFEEKITPKKINAESWFLECFKKYKGKSFRILMGLYRGNYQRLLLSSALFIIKNSPVWILPIITSKIINDVVTGNENVKQNLFWYAMIMLILYVINVPFHYLHTAYKSKVTRYVETGLRKVLVRKLQQLSINYHKATQSGKLHSKIMRDVEAVESLSTQLFVSMLNIVLNISIALFVTLQKSTIVFLFLIVTTPVAACILVLFRKTMGKRNREFRMEMENTSAKVMEMVELIPITRAHALEDDEVQKVSKQLFEVAEKGYRLDMVQAIFGSVGWVVFQTFQVICLIFTGYLAIRGEILVGDITLYQTYFTTIVNQVTTVMALLPIISKGFESLNSIGEVLLSDDIEENEGKEVIKDIAGNFEFKNVHFTYPDDQSYVLKGLNLTVKEGETIALVGESGSGKSTILNLVIGYDKADNGQVLLDGKDLKDIDLRSYRKHIAVVPQTSVLFSGTIAENITYGLENVSEKQLYDVIEAANLSEVVEKMPYGLNTMVGESGGKLSGGQRQRVSIARALLRNPKIIVLDEATSALDSISEKKIQDAIDNLAKGRTMFIVAHRLSTIQNADKIAVIDRGQCVEYGTFNELMEKKGRFYEMKMMQA